MTQNVLYILGAGLFCTAGPPGHEQLHREI